MIGRLPIKLVAPLTDWKDHNSNSAWHVRVDPDRKNGLIKRSAVDALQLRSIDHLRFMKLGEASPEILRDVLVAVALVIEYPL